MEVPAVCITLSVHVLMLLAEVHLLSAQESDTLIVPTKLQLFEYTSVSITCEGANATVGWAVMRQVKGKVSQCVSTWATAPPSHCAIKPAYSTDSGEYWCEAGGRRSNAVTITVTTGSVILESPALPVTEGDSVTLSCRTRTSSPAPAPAPAPAPVASFYKDGALVWFRSTGQMSITAVSRADQGLYSCSVSELGESPQSWLAVRAAHRETRPSPDRPCHVYVLLRTFFTVFMVFLLLLLVGLLHCGKLRATRKITVTRSHIQAAAEGNETEEKTAESTEVNE